MSAAYESALDISFDVRAGLVMRQIHHWAALLFLAVDRRAPRPRVLHRRVPPAARDQLDDRRHAADPRHRQRLRRLLAARRPAVGHRACASRTASCCRSRSSARGSRSLLFGGEFPGPDIIERLYVIHILIVPVDHRRAARRPPRDRRAPQAHAVPRARAAREDNVVGERLWPTYAAKALGLFFLDRRGAVPARRPRPDQPDLDLRPVRPGAGVAPARSPTGTWAGSTARCGSCPAGRSALFGFEIPNPFFPGVLPRRAHVRAALRLAVPRGPGHRRPRRAPPARPAPAAAGAHRRSASATLAFYLGAVPRRRGRRASPSTFDAVGQPRAHRRSGSLVFVVPVVAAWVTYRLCKELSARDGVPDRVEGAASREIPGGRSVAAPTATRRRRTAASR